jgi:hypothetical protein
MDLYINPHLKQHQQQQQLQLKKLAYLLLDVNYVNIMVTCLTHVQLKI